MKKPKVKRKAPLRNKPCTCDYNKKIAGMFDECLRSIIHDEGSSEEYYTALCHSEEFGSMANAANDPDCDASYVLADSFRFGWEAGKRSAELSNLEKMVGY
jgi:hypothetical protein